MLRVVPPLLILLVAGCGGRKVATPPPIAPVPEAAVDEETLAYQARFATPSGQPDQVGFLGPDDSAILNGLDDVRKLSLLSSLKPTVRAEAAKAFAQVAHPSPELLEALSRLLLDTSVEVRREASRALIYESFEWPPPDNLPLEALAAALADPDDETASNAARALGAVGEPAGFAVQAMAKQLKRPLPTWTGSTRHMPAREAAAGSLGALGSPSEPFVDELATLLDGPCRRAAARSLGRLAGGEPHLLQRLRGPAHFNDADLIMGLTRPGPRSAPLVKVLAERGLDGRFGDPARRALASVRPTSDAVVAALVGIAHQGQGMVRGSAVRTLAGLEPQLPSIAVALRELAAGDDRELREAATKTLLEMAIEEQSRRGAAPTEIEDIAAALDGRGSVANRLTALSRLSAGCGRDLAARGRLRNTLRKAQFNPSIEVRAYALALEIETRGDHVETVAACTSLLAGLTATQIEVRRTLLAALSRFQTCVEQAPLIAALARELDEPLLLIEAELLVRFHATAREQLDALLANLSTRAARGLGTEATMAALARLARDSGMEGVDIERLVAALAELLDRDDLPSSTRRSLLAGLGEFPAREELAPLKDRCIAALDSAETRAEAARGLASQGRMGTDATPPLLQFLEGTTEAGDETTDAARQVLLAALGRVGAPAESLPVLRAALGRPETRAVAATALVRLGPESAPALAEIAEAIRSLPDEQERAEVVGAFFEWGAEGGAALPLLRAVIDEDPAPAVVLAAARSALGIADDETLRDRLMLLAGAAEGGLGVYVGDTALMETCKALMLDALRSPDLQVRRGVLAALQSTTAEARGFYRDVALAGLESDDAATRLAAVRLLGESADTAERTTPVWIEALDADDPAERAEAEERLMALGPRSFRALRAAAEDPARSPAIRCAACKLLLRSPRPSVYRETFLSMVRDEAPTTHDWGLVALGIALPGAAPAEELLRLSDASDPAVRALAVRGLPRGPAVHDAALTALLTAIGDDEAAVADAATEAFAAITLSEPQWQRLAVAWESPTGASAAIRAAAAAAPAPPQALRHLARAMTSPNPEVAEAAGRALAASDEAAIPWLLVVASGAQFSSATRRAAIAALGEQPSLDTEALQRLVRLAEECSDPMLRREAAVSLGRLGRADSMALDTLLESLGDPDNELSRRAVAALAEVAAGSESTMRTLNELSRQGDPRRRALATETLAITAPETPGLVETLGELLDTEQRAVALRGIVALGPRAAPLRDMVTELLADEPNRPAAYQSLQQLGEAAEDVVEDLIVTLRRHPEELPQVAEVLEAIGRSAQLLGSHDLVKALDDPRHMRVVAGALSKLEFFGTNSVDRLLQLLDDESTRLEAIESLGLFGERAAKGAPKMYEALQAATSEQERTAIRRALRAVDPKFADQVGIEPVP